MIGSLVKWLELVSSGRCRVPRCNSKISWIYIPCDNDSPEARLPMTPSSKSIDAHRDAYTSIFSSSVNETTLQPDTLLSTIRTRSKCPHERNDIVGIWFRLSLHLVPDWMAVRMICTKEHLTVALPLVQWSARRFSCLG